MLKDIPADALPAEAQLFTILKEGMPYLHPEQGDVIKIHKLYWKKRERFGGLRPTLLGDMTLIDDPHSYWNNHPTEDLKVGTKQTECMISGYFTLGEFEEVPGYGTPLYKVLND